MRRPMKRKKGIGWTEETWNPTTGCDRISPGCDHCYALDLAASLKRRHNVRYQNDGDPETSGPGFGFTVHDDVIDRPRRWARPRFVFVNSMSDLFHEDMPLEMLQRIFATMAETPQHTYQVLTKRAHRLRDLAPDLPWPPNVWMGVSIENQRYAFRSRILSEVEGPALKFLSMEPLIGPVDDLPIGGIDWVIVGDESGNRGRPMHPAWVRSLIRQVGEAGPDRPRLFVKQWGRWKPAGPTDAIRHLVGIDGAVHSVPLTRRVTEWDAHAVPMKATRGKAELPAIDGWVWDEMPVRAEEFRGTMFEEG